MNPRYLHMGLVMATLVLLVVALHEESSTGDSPATGIAPRPRTMPRALSAIPKQARFVLNIDLAASGAEPLRELLFSTDHELEGLGRLTDVCGYDPSPHIRELVITAFSESQNGGLRAGEPQFAVVAAGDFDQQRLVGCAKKLVASRGGTPEHQSIQALTLVRDRAKQGYEIAILESGLVLVANHSSLRSMLRVLDGQAADITQNETHRSLAKALGDDHVALATLDLGMNWLARLFEQEDLSRSRLKDLKAAGWSLGIGRRVTLRGILRCNSDRGCQQLEEFLNQLVTEFSPVLEQRFGKLPFQDISLRRQGATLDVLWTLSPAALTSLLRQIGQTSRAPPGPARTPAAPSAAPDETIFVEP